jgi:hypothetical protein
VNFFFEAHTSQGSQERAGKEVHHEVGTKFIDEGSGIFGVADTSFSPGMTLKNPIEVILIHVYHGNLVVFLFQKILNAWPGYPAGSEYENLAHSSITFLRE